MQPHAARRTCILRAHPEVRRLTGPEWRTKWIALGVVASHLGLSVLAPRLPWTAYLLVLYLVGATLAQALFLLVHELAHDLAFRTAAYNRWFALLVNLPLGVPYAVAFRAYHLEHHAHQGVDGVDTDVPTAWECAVVRGPWTKAAWLSCQILAYALRPLLVRPQPVTAMHACNWLVQLAFDALLYAWVDEGPLVYLLLSVWLAGGLHPCAGHFLSEHYVRHGTQETYSYYGPLNRLTLNVGYHNEHHDFPRVAWSRLPEVTRLAPEAYEDLVVCDSWIGALRDYVRREDMGPWCRVRRARKE